MCRVWKLVGPKGSEGVGLFAFFSKEKGFLAVSWVWYRRFDFFAYLWYVHREVFGVPVVKEYSFLDWYWWSPLLYQCLLV